MRRSAAPSQLSFKRPRFSPPFVGSKENLLGSTHQPKVIPIELKENHSTRSADDILRLFNDEPPPSPLRDDYSSGEAAVASKSQQFPMPSSPTPTVNCFQSRNINVSSATDVDAKKRHFAVIWCKQSTRKHKKWEGDGILTVTGRTVILQDQEGKQICRASGYKVKELEDLDECSNLKVGGKEVEICNSIDSGDYASGKCFMACQDEAVQAPVRAADIKPFVCPSAKLPGQSRKICVKFSADAPDAFVMPRPSAMHQWQFNKKEMPVIDVVVDPHLASKLRPHQKEGIVFLYECVMGFRNNFHVGAILADDMGLGKTLQCITLIWTLLKQGPYGGLPVLKKVLVVTPSSLVKNWLQEFKRWLGSERIAVYGVDQNNKVEVFIKSRLHSVLVISYEMFVRSVETLDRVCFDLVICDEGHRLKNTSIKTTATVSSISTKRRIVLTGTPIQNDLQEFFSIIEFCNPCILGSSAKFKKVYEVPILKSNEPDAGKEARDLGEARAAELNRLISLFTLRRTSEVISKYLPPKVEMVVLCKPSSLQVALYQQLISSRLLKNCLSGFRQNGSVHLVCIAALKKLCNHPSLIHEKSLEADNEDLLDCAAETVSLYQDLISSFPTDFESNKFAAAHSGKMLVVSRILSCLHQGPQQEKIVLVSSYTQTLDILENFCKSENYATLRLDGSTPSALRQALVDKFNNKFSHHTVFLLSSKAGGVGLNLIGASRILLYDIDWNPATDLQAMARVWRDGQKKKVFIYRLLIAGSIEEKIYQRQITKQGISGSVVDMNDSSKAQFSLSDLKDIFSFETDCPSSTHDLLECLCDQSGNRVLEKQSSAANEAVDDVRPCQLRPPSTVKLSKKISMAELLEWKHYRGPITDGMLEDPFLTAAGNDITFVFENKS